MRNLPLCCDYDDSAYFWSEKQAYIKTAFIDGKLFIRDNEGVYKINQIAFDSDGTIEIFKGEKVTTPSN